MEIAKIEKLIASFDSSVVVIEDLVRSSNKLIEENKELRARIDTKEYLSFTQNDLLKTLKEQSILNKSLIYLFESDQESIKDIYKIAKAQNDHEVMGFWAKRLRNEQ